MGLKKKRGQKKKGKRQFILAIPAVVSIVFGIKWYRSRKEVDVSDDASTSAIQKP